MFIAGSAEEKEGLKKDSFKFFETELIKRTKKEALEEMFITNIDR